MNDKARNLLQLGRILLRIRVLEGNTHSCPSAWTKACVTTDFVRTFVPATKLSIRLAKFFVCLIFADCSSEVIYAEITNRPVAKTCGYVRP